MTYQDGEPPADGVYDLELFHKPVHLSKNEHGWWVGREPQCFHMQRWHALRFSTEQPLDDRVKLTRWREVT